MNSCKFIKFSSSFFFFQIVCLSGVINNEGPDWKILRRTTISSLRDFGLGKATIESAILDEADVLAELLDKQVDSQVDMAPLFGCSTLNIICHIAFRTRFESECSGLLRDITA